MKIEVVDYDPKWPEIYESERLLLLGNLQGIIENIYHIGSTSIESLAAKPIIDIVLEVRSLDALDNATCQMETIGYEAKGEYGISGRRYFRKGKIRRTHQLHAFLSNDKNVTRHIAFRNYLREHPNVMKEYASLKVVLARTCNNDINVYCDGKEEFVKYYEAKAIEWNKITYQKN